MGKDQILMQLIKTFRDTLDNNDIDLTYETVATDIDEWDSLNHIQLVYAIESEFKITFNAIEIQTWKNVNDLVESIQKKI